MATTARKQWLPDRWFDLGDVFMSGLLYSRVVESNDEIVSIQFLSPTEQVMLMTDQQTCQDANYF